MWKKLLCTWVLSLSACLLWAQYRPLLSPTPLPWRLSVEGGAQQSLLRLGEHEQLSHLAALGLHRQFSPVFALGLEGEWQEKGRAPYDYPRTALHAVGSLNLMNWLGGWKGRARIFEIEPFISAGWGHSFREKGLADENYLVSKLGASLRFNMGRARQWSLALRPSISYDLRGGGADFERFDARQAVAQVTLQLSYSWGRAARHEKYGHVPYTASSFSTEQTALDALREVNQYLQGELEQRSKVIERQQSVIDSLKQAASHTFVVNNPVVQVPAPYLQANAATAQAERMAVRRNGHVEGASEQLLRAVVLFRLGSTVIDNSQFAEIRKLGNFLQSHPATRVVIHGYASPDGGYQANLRIAQLRADAVKYLLIAQYQIAHERITAEPVVLSQSLAEPALNRSSVCAVFAL